MQYQRIINVSNQIGQFCIDSRNKNYKLEE